MFEADTSNVCPLDFIRINLQFFADLGTEELHTCINMLVPNINYKINPIQPLKIVSTPLSRLLLGR